MIFERNFNGSIVHFESFSMRFENFCALNDISQNRYSSQMQTLDCECQPSNCSHVETRGIKPK